MLKLDDILENTPRKDMFYKDKLKEYSLELLESILLASYSENKIDYYPIIKTKIAVIDF